MAKKDRGKEGFARFGVGVVWVHEGLVGESGDGLNPVAFFFIFILSPENQRQFRTRERGESRQGPSLPRQRLPPPWPDFGGARARRSESIPAPAGAAPSLRPFLPPPPAASGLAGTGGPSLPPGVPHRHRGSLSGTCPAAGRPPRAGGGQGLPSLPPLSLSPSIPPAPAHPQVPPAAARVEAPPAAGSGRGDPDRAGGTRSGAGAGPGVAVPRGRP